MLSTVIIRPCRFASVLDTALDSTLLPYLRVPPYLPVKVRLKKNGLAVIIAFVLTLQFRRCTLMFSPSLNIIEVLWPLLTSAALCISIRAYLRLRLSQISPGKNTDLHPMYLPHLPPKIPGSGRALFCFANSPTYSRLNMRFLSVGAELCRRLPSDLASQQRPCL